MNQFKIQNSKFKIKFTQTLGVGFIPTLGDKDSFSDEREQRPAGRGFEPSLFS
jgi:hypothetical protein